MGRYGNASYGFGFGITEFNKFFGGTIGGYGTKLRDEVKRYYGAVVGISGRGESVALEDNYCEIDPQLVDEYGIPVLRFHYKWSEYERLQAKHLHETFETIFDNMGATTLGDAPGKEQDYGLNRVLHYPNGI